MCEFQNISSKKNILKQEQLIVVNMTGYLPHIYLFIYLQSFVFKLQTQAKDNRAVMPQPRSLTKPDMHKHT